MRIPLIHIPYMVIVCPPVVELIIYLGPKVLRFFYLEINGLKVDILNNVLDENKL